MAKPLLSMQALRRRPLEEIRQQPGCSHIGAMADIARPVTEASGLCHRVGTRSHRYHPPLKDGHHANQNWLRGTHGYYDPLTQVPGQQPLLVSR